MGLPWPASMPSRHGPVYTLRASIADDRGRLHRVRAAVPAVASLYIRVGVECQALRCRDDSISLMVLTLSRRCPTRPPRACFTRRTAAGLDAALLGDPQKARGLSAATNSPMDLRGHVPETTLHRLVLVWNAWRYAMDRVERVVQVQDAGRASMRHGASRSLGPIPCLPSRHCLRQAVSHRDYRDSADAVATGIAIGTQTRD
jgi:hypothetical protein